MSAILFAAISMLNLSFVNSLVLIAAVVVVAALIIAYMAQAYKATPTIEWEAAPAPIAEDDFLRSIKRCKDGVYMVSFEACGKVYHRRMPNKVRGKASYRAFILEKYASLFIEVPVADEAPTIEKLAKVVQAFPIGVKTPSIDTWEKMEAAIEQGAISGNGWHRMGDFVTRYRGDASYVRFLKVGDTLRFISDHAVPC